MASNPTGTLAVDSLPAKAVVYALRAVDEHAPLHIDKLDIGKVARRRHRLGKAPVRAEVEVGPYWVAVTYARKLFERTDDLPRSEHSIDDVFPFITSVGARLEIEEYDGSSGSFRAITKAYREEVRAGEPATIRSISLPVPSGDRKQRFDTILVDPNGLDEPSRKSLTHVYPAPASVASLPDRFPFNDEAIVKVVGKSAADAGIADIVDDDLAAATAGVLRKTGKVGVFSPGTYLAVEKTDDGFSVTRPYRRR